MPSARPDPKHPDPKRPTPDARHDAKHSDQPSHGTAPPAAGPHAKPSLTEPEKTPGAGSLPDPRRPREGDATTG